MAQSIALRHLLCNIPRWCMSVAVYASRPDDCIERLKALGGKEHCRAKTSNMQREMEDNVGILDTPVLAYTYDEVRFVRRHHSLNALEDLFRYKIR